MTTRTRTFDAHIASAMFALLSGLDPESRRLVLDDILEDDPDVVAGHARAIARRAASLRRGADVPMPIWLPDLDVDRGSWLGLIEDGARSGAALHDVGGTLVARVGGEAEEARSAITENTTGAAATREQLELHEDRWALSGAASPATLRRLRLSWFGWAALLGPVAIVEASAISYSVLTEAGVLEGAVSLSSVGFEVVSRGGLMMLAALGVTCVFMHFMRKVAVRTSVALATVAAGGTAVFSSIACSRWLAMMPSASITDELLMLQVANNALFVAASSIIVALVLDHIVVRMRALSHAAATIEDEESRYLKKRDLLNTRLSDHDKRVGDLRALTQRPDELADCFERGVSVMRRRLEEERVWTDEEVERIMSHWRRTQTLGRAEREHLHMSMYRFVEEDEEAHDDRTDGERTSSALFSRPGLVGVLLLGLGLPGLTGCGSDPVPAGLIAVCDGTGARPEDSCTNDFLADLIAHHHAGKGHARGSFSQVIMTAGAFKDVRVEDALRVPHRWDGSARHAWHDWQRDAVKTARAYTVPTDAGDKSVNKSDILSATLVAARAARGPTCGKIDLVVASDGRQIGLGINALRSASADGAVSALERQGVVLDLSCFASITLCGIHHGDATPADVEALETMWSAIVAAGNGPEPSIEPSCRGLYPAAPAAIAMDDSVRAGR